MGTPSCTYLDLVPSESSRSFFACNFLDLLHFESSRSFFNQPLSCTRNDKSGNASTNLNKHPVLVLYRRFCALEGAARLVFVFVGYISASHARPVCLIRFYLLRPRQPGLCDWIDRSRGGVADANLQGLGTEQTFGRGERGPRT